MLTFRDPVQYAGTQVGPTRFRLGFNLVTCSLFHALSCQRMWSALHGQRIPANLYSILLSLDLLVVAQCSLHRQDPKRPEAAGGLWGQSAKLTWAVSWQRVCFENILVLISTWRRDRVVDRGERSWHCTSPDPLVCCLFEVCLNSLWQRPEIKQQFVIRLGLLGVQIIEKENNYFYLDLLMWF